jgi:hypothetical protein
MGENSGPRETNQPTERRIGTAEVPSFLFALRIVGTENSTTQKL